MALILAVAFLLAGGIANQAQAASVYVGTYSDGTDAYLLTHTVNITNYRPYTFSCTVRSAGTSLYYNFFSVNGSPYYRNSMGYEAYVFGGASPVAANIYRYVTSHW